MDNNFLKNKSRKDAVTRTDSRSVSFLEGKSRKDYELLMPAGSFEKAKYAIEFGCDAIYCGIPMFTLRGKSTMTMDELKEIVPYAHERGVKVYFAVNIFPHSFKYEQFLKDMKVMVEEIKPDAFIMADPGLIDVTKENFPQAEIHLSVQANNVNWMSVKFWQKQGITRVVLARELTYPELVEINKKVPDIELEFFIHGSNCIAYSGRCLLSNYFNYRDSNQGVCNNACRFEYKVYKSKDNEFLEPLQEGRHYKDLEKGKYFIEEEKRKGELFEVEEDNDGTYLFNSKDNCMVEHLEKMMKAGVCSYKVEGRTKSVYYAAIVARTYRKVLDDILAGKKPDIDWAIKELNTTSNRGFIPGFLEGNPKENSIDYAKKSSHQTHLFVGIVREVISSSEEKSILEVETRAKFKLGDKIEFVTPNEIKTWIVDKIEKPMQDSPNEELEKVSGGLEFYVKLEVPFKIKDKYCVVRRILYDKEKV
ncbi:MAG: U32 family peptidase C-terminal domain-containing protein [Candidatus Woesearchaeota archaeon]|jgi:putative protease|nr:U32 family peptidase C-terminal domain-containing protein [Candidatus Woesearchaeota archaeon]